MLKKINKFLNKSSKLINALYLLMMSILIWKISVIISIIGIVISIVNIAYYFLNKTKTYETDIMFNDKVEVVNNPRYKEVYTIEYIALKEDKVYYKINNSNRLFSNDELVKTK